MSEAAHTPGPWRVVDYGDDDREVLAVHRDRENRICFMAAPGSEGDAERIAADARLIAAAPQLLAALKAYMDHRSEVFHLQIQGKPIGREFAQRMDDILDQMNAALRLAEGKDTP